MVQKTFDRITVVANLRKIEEGDCTPEIVKEIDDILRGRAKEADRTQRFMQTREGGGFLEDQLEVQDLKQVGHYNTSRRTGRKFKFVEFSKGDITITFSYKRKDYGVLDSLRDVTDDDSNPNLGRNIMGALDSDNIGSDRLVNDGVDIGLVTQDAILSTLTGKGPSHHQELSLGKKNARTLVPYQLDRVEVVRTSPLKIFGYEILFLPVGKKETVYSANS